MEYIFSIGIWYKKYIILLFECNSSLEKTGLKSDISAALTQYSSPRTSLLLLKIFVRGLQNAYFKNTIKTPQRVTSPLRKATLSNPFTYITSHVQQCSRVPHYHFVLLSHSRDAEENERHLLWRSPPLPHFVRKGIGACVRNQ